MSVKAVSAQRLPTTRVWTVDPRHSSVGFRVKHHAFATYRAGFADFEGRYDGESRVLSGSATVESIQTFDMLRDRLFEADFFEAERYPTISFVSTSIDSEGDAVTVAGDLTLKGVTRRVNATGTVSETSRVKSPRDGSVKDHFGIDLDATIDRRDFGVDFNNELYDGRLNLGWAVTLELALELAAPVEEGEDGEKS